MNKRIYLIIVEIVAAAMLLLILFYRIPANHQPAIISLGARPEGIFIWRAARLRVMLKTLIETG